jgi:type III secretion protein U
VSGDRTEAPSARRLREARGRGQVAISAELTAAAALAGGLAALALRGSACARDLARWMRAALASAPLSEPDPAAALVRSWNALLGAVLVPAGCAAVCALAAGVLQTGFLFAPGALAPRLERLDPLRGLGHLFSWPQLAAAALGLARAAALVGIGVLWLRDAAPALAGLGRLDAGGLWRSAPLLLELGTRLALALLALGTVDLLRVRRRHLRSLRRTADEVRRELREEEGDPALRGERRRLHRGLVEAGPISRATVVVVNPTHLAVALRHDRDGPDAPRVVAKGAGRGAARIRSAARRAGVPVVHDVALARALHRLTEVGEEIPEELYQAAAVVLAHLYGAKERA